MCNLSEVMVREHDTVPTLKRKVELATILGTVQATYTKMPYLRPIWSENTKEEALLGVSLTGIMDNKFMSRPNDKEVLEGVLEYLKEAAVETNVKYAAAFGINPSTAVTCIKPSGTVSQLTDTASGIHARHSPYYIRTVRGDIKDPLTQFMKSIGVPNEPCVMNPASTVVFSFPQKSPAGAVTRNDMSALEQLELWLTYQRHWCEHKPSVTITVRDEEWMEVGAWVYKNFDEVSGVSFLPHSDHTYQQAPYQEVGKSDYDTLSSLMPEDINWADLSFFEKEDTTKSSQTLACVSGECEIVDI